MNPFRSVRPQLAWPLLLMLTACRGAGDGTIDAIARPEPARSAASAPTVPDSPWDAAAARGVAFRAVGNEPGWYAEVDRGAVPAMRATLDYGDRRVEVPHAVALDGDASGYHGKARNGTSVVLRIRREPCSDGMSDQTYDTSVTLDVGDTTYRGCGRFLGD